MRFLREYLRRSTDGQIDRSNNAPHPFAGTRDGSDSSIGIFTDNMRLVRANSLPSNPGRGTVNAPRILKFPHLAYPRSSLTNGLNHIKTPVPSQL